MNKKCTILCLVMFLTAFTVKAQQFQVQVDKNSHAINSSNNIVEVHYDSIHTSAIGSLNTNFIIAARLTSAKLAPYLGQSLKSIRVYIQSAPVASVGTVRIYGAGSSISPGSILYSSEPTLVDSNSWNDIPLTIPLTIPSTDLWIGFQATSTGYPFWAGCDGGPNNPDGQWIFTNNSWFKLASLNPAFTFNWNIRAEVENVTPVELKKFTAININDKIILNWSTSTEKNNRGFEIQKKFGNNGFNTIGFMSGCGTTTESQKYSYSDNHCVPGKYFYRLKQVDYNGVSEYSKQVEVVVNPFGYELFQNYPNPFNPSTVIKYQLPQNSFVSLKVYNSLGKEVATLVNGMVNAGINQVQFDLSNLSSGAYYYVIKAGNHFEQTRKMILQK